jgi:hypothetical protein
MSSYNLSLQSLSLSSSSSSSSISSSSSPDIYSKILKTEWNRRSNEKYLLKPSTYYEAILQITQQESHPTTTSASDTSSGTLSEDLLSNIYVLLVDSDILWSNLTLESLWNKYECVRNDQDLVISSELNCWLGRYCTHEDLHNYYQKPQGGYSVFVNSGAIIGKITLLKRILQQIIQDSHNYYVETALGKKFDDQFAFTKYLFSHGIGTLDIHQELFGTFQIYNFTQIPSPKDGYVCKVTASPDQLRVDTNPNPREDKARRNLKESVDQSLDPMTLPSKNLTFTQELANHLDKYYSIHCIDFTPAVYRREGYSLDPKTCNIVRDPQKIQSFSSNLYSVMSTLAHQPILWHGNGGGKKFFSLFKTKVEHCVLTNNGINISQYSCNDHGCQVRDSS